MEFYGNNHYSHAETLGLNVVGLARGHSLLNLGQYTYFGGSDLLTKCTVFVPKIMALYENITFNDASLKFSAEQPNSSQPTF